MNNKTKIIVFSVSCIIAFSLGYFTTPTKTELKEIVKTQTLTTEGKTKVVYRDRVIYPDGKIEEHEEEREDTKIVTESSSEAKKEVVTTKDVGLVLAVLAVKDMKAISGETGAQIGVSKRVLGGLGLAASLTSYKDEKLVGVGLSWSF